MDIINVILNIIGVLFLGGFFGFLVSLPILLFIELVLKKELDKKKINTIFATVSIIVALYLGALYWYGDHQVGSVFECKNYQDELYYANLFPEDSATKNYRIIVDLSRVGGEYAIEHVYFNKRQYITVDNINDYLRVNEKVFFSSTDGRHWYIELTSQRAKDIPE